MVQGHPDWHRCSFLKYSRYSRSSRLAIRAPRSGIHSRNHQDSPLAQRTRRRLTEPASAQGAPLVAESRAHRTRAVEVGAEIRLALSQLLENAFERADDLFFGSGPLAEAQSKRAGLAGRLEAEHVALRTTDFGALSLLPDVLAGDRSAFTGDLLDELEHLLRFALSRHLQEH